MLRGIPLLAKMKDLEEACEHVIASGKSSQWNVQDGAGAWFSLRIGPCKATNQNISGAVLTLTNVTALDIGAFTSDLETHRHIPKIRDDFMGGARSGVNGTPTLFINGERFDNPADEALLTRAIDAARRHRHVEASP
jgi:hypothetical protein